MDIFTHAILSTTSDSNLTLIYTNGIDQKKDNVSKILFSVDVDSGDILFDTIDELYGVWVDYLSVLVMPTVDREQIQNFTKYSESVIDDYKKVIQLSDSDLKKIRELGVCLNVRKTKVYSVLDLARYYSISSAKIIVFKNIDNKFYYIAARKGKVLSIKSSEKFNKDKVEIMMKLCSIEDVISLYNMEENDLFLSLFDNFSFLTENERKTVSPALSTFLINPMDSFDNENYIGGDFDDINEGLEDFYNSELSDNDDEPEELLGVFEDEDDNYEEDDNNDTSEFDEEIDINEDLESDTDDDQDDEDSDIRSKRNKSRNIDDEDEDVKDGTKKKKKSFINKLLNLFGAVVVVGVVVGLTGSKIVPTQLNYLDSKISELGALSAPYKNTAYYLNEYSNGLSTNKNITAAVLNNVGNIKINGVVGETKIDHMNVSVRVYLANPKDIDTVKSELGKYFNVQTYVKGSVMSKGNVKLTAFTVSGTLNS